MTPREQYIIAYRAVRMHYSCGYDGYYWLQTGIAVMDRFLGAAYDSHSMDWKAGRDRIEDTRAYWRYLSQHLIGSRQFARCQKTEAIKLIREHYRESTRLNEVFGQ